MTAPRSSTRERWTPVRTLTKRQRCSFCRVPIPAFSPGSTSGSRYPRAWVNPDTWQYECLGCRSEAERADRARVEALDLARSSEAMTEGVQYDVVVSVSGSLLRGAPAFSAALDAGTLSALSVAVATEAEAQAILGDHRKANDSALAEYRARGGARAGAPLAAAQHAF